MTAADPVQPDYEAFERWKSTQQSLPPSDQINTDEEPLEHKVMLLLDHVRWGEDTYLEQFLKLIHQQKKEAFIEGRKKGRLDYEVAIFEHFGENIPSGDCLQIIGKLPRAELKQEDKS